MCGINDLGAQGRDYMYILCPTSLNMAILLHKTVRFDLIYIEMIIVIFHNATSTVRAVPLSLP